MQRAKTVSDSSRRPEDGVDETGAVTQSDAPATDDRAGAQHLSSLAAKHAEDGEFSEAMAAYQQALVLDPSSASRYAALARVGLKAKALPVAQEAAEQCVHLEPDNATRWVLLARVSEAAGNPARAREAWKHAIDLGYRAPAAHVSLARACLALDDLAAAGRALEAAVALPDPKPEWWALLGSVRHRMGDDDGAHDAYSSAVSGRPDRKWLAILAELRRTRGERAGRGGRRPASSAYYDRAYSGSTAYDLDPELSQYIPLWRSIAEKIAASGRRRLVDVGCGPGQFAAFILQEIAGLAYLGVDFSREAIEKAMGRCPDATFSCDDVESTDLLRVVEYDVIVSTEFLEHIEGDLAVLKTIKPGTYVLASVPNFDSFGHVRYFDSEAAVAARYGELFRDFRVESFDLNPKARLFLLSGIRV